MYIYEIAGGNFIVQKKCNRESHTKSSNPQHPTLASESLYGDFTTRLGSPKIDLKLVLKNEVINK